MGEPGDNGDYDRIVARHGVWFTSMPAARHLPRLVRDFRRVNNYNKPYLAGMTAETLTAVGEYGHGRRWFRWARDNAHSRGQEEWLRGREGFLWLDVDGPAHVPDNPVGMGAAYFAMAQAKLANRDTARAAIDRAGRYTAYRREPYTAFTYPEFLWHSDASKVHTRLGDAAAAMDHQREALTGAAPRRFLVVVGHAAAVAGGTDTAAVLSGSAVLARQPRRGTRCGR